MTPSALNTGDPLYLGHSLEQWLTDFVAAEEVDHADLVCQALPCFGEAFIRRAVELIDTVEEAKQALLVSCIANAGRPSVPSLVRLLAHSSAKVRAAACTGLAVALDTEPDNSPAIMQMMRDFLHGPRLSRDELVEFFDKLDTAYADEENQDPINVDVLVALMGRLEDEDDAVRLAAIEALHRLKLPPKTCPGVLTTLLYVLEHDVSPEVRKVAAWMLGRSEMTDQLETLTPSTLACLSQVLDDANPTIRQTVVAVVQKLRTKGAVDVAPILQSDGQSEVSLGPLATCELFSMVPELVPGLMARLCDSRADVRACAAEALARASKHLGWTKGRRDAAVPALAELLNDDVSEVRVAAVRALALLKKPSSADVNEILAKAAQHHDPAVRGQAISALRSFTGELMDMDQLEPDEPETSRRTPAVPAPVWRAQARCDQLAAAPLERVAAALHDRDIAVRLAAVKVLREFDRVGEDVSGYLFDALRDPCHEVRWGVHAALRGCLVQRSTVWSQ